jgi:suppressor of ftsI
MLRRFLVLALSGLLVTSAFAQDGQMDHSQHAMPMTATSGDSLLWRMAPMTLPMPMLPGLENAVPMTGAYLPGVGMDPMMFPEGKPREIVEMKDGDTLHLEASLIRRTIAGRTFIMYGYNQQYPGPLIRAERGSTITVHFMNNIEMPSTVHWHGLRLDNASDGVPGVTQDPVLTGGSFTYTLHFKDTGLFWYHPHIREDIQQDLGLYGNMLVDPPEPDYYAPVNREEIVILDDLLMDAAGLFPFGESTPTHTLMGRFGNVMLINGQTSLRIDVNRGDVVRFYLTNVANSRSFNVVFDGAPIKVVASDVSKYERDQWVESIVIAPAERYVVDVQFEEDRVYQITNSIQAINHFRGEFFAHVDTLGAVHAGPSVSSPDYTESFASLRENSDVQNDIDDFRRYFDREPDHSLELTLKVHGLPLPIVRMMEIDTLYVPPMEWNDAMPMMNWLSDGNQVEWIIRDLNTGRENMDLEWKFRTGEVSKIRIFNNPKSFHPMNHPFHMHGQRFLILSVDGVPNENMAWKDTVIIPVGSTIDLLLDASNPGKWMAHCHIAEHLHAGMMMRFDVIDELDPQ